MFQFLIANFSSQSLGFQPPKPRQVNTFEPAMVAYTVENIHQFPSNLLVHIFKSADLEDLLALSAVCKKFWMLTSRNNLELWKYKVEERWREMGVYDWLDELCTCEFPEAQLMKQRLLLPSSVDWRWMAQALKARIPADGQDFTGLGFELVEKTFSFGMWKNGLLDGPGVRIHQGKHLYFGDWEAGRWNGHGTVLSSTPETGGLYIGQYKQSMSEGYGLKKWANGATYYGEWKKNRINGHGVYTWANGSEYDGSWKNNERSGIGHYKWANGSKYYGEWKRNNFEGRGTKIYENGDVYRGMWENDLQNGQGTYITSYGAKFDGVFKAGERARGTFTHADGYSWTGAFNRNIPTEESAIHPVVRSALEKRQCTRTACPADKFYGQVLFQCVACSSGARDVYLCPTCAGHCGHQQGHPLEAVWTFGASRCGCTVCHPHENAAESNTTRNTSPEK